MKNNILRGIMMMALVIVSIGVAAGQGLTWESITTIPAAKGKEIYATSYYRPHMFKQLSENSATIFHLDKELMYLIDYDKKEYSEMTFAEMEAFTKKANSELEDKMAEMEKQLENMPPEERKMMEKMMENKGVTGKSSDKVDVTKTTEKKTISGYACIKYVLKEGGKEIGSVWTTTSVPDFSSMKKDFKEFSQRITAQMPMKGKQMAAAMEKVEGFTIQITIAGITTTVTKIEKKPVASSEFEIPSGYKKVEPQKLTDE